MKKNTFFISCLLINVMFSQQIDLKVADQGLFYVSKATNVFISNGGNLNISNSGGFVMDSDSDEFSNVFVDGTSTGDAEYRRWTASAATRDLIAPPVSGEPFNEFYNRNSSVLVAGTQDAQTGDFLFGHYDNNQPDGQYYESLSTDTYIISSGKGYRSARISGGTLSFQGVVSTGNVPVTITAGTGKNRYANLIGNPYTTSISASSLLTAMAGSDALNSNYIAIYGYDGDVTSSGDTWIVINSASVLASGDVDIMPGQGFMVYADSDGGTFAFTKAMQKVASSDDFLAGKSSVKKSGKVDFFHFALKINEASNETNKYTTDLYFVNNHVTRGLDPGWDAGSFSDLSNKSLAIATFLSDNSSSETAFAIQSLPLSDLSSPDLIVPLYVNAKAGVTYKISMDQSTIPSGTDLYIEDAELKTFTLLEDTYTFTATEALNGKGRFYLTTSKTLNTDTDVYQGSNVQVISLLNEKQILVSGMDNKIGYFSLIDLSGRVVMNQNLVDVSNDKQYVDVSSISMGVYIVRLKLENESVVTKKVLIN